MPTVISLQLHQAEGQPLTAVAETRGLLDLGLEGDSHSQRGPGRKRQVLILDEATLRHFSLQPGQLREQITLRGLPEITILDPGRRLTIGEVTFEAVGDCAPCLYIGGLLGVEDPEAFRQALEKRRGLLCRVVAVSGKGRIRLGDEVTLR